MVGITIHHVPLYHNNEIVKKIIEKIFILTLVKTV